MTTGEHEPERQFEPGEREEMQAYLEMGASILRRAESLRRMEDLERLSLEIIIPDEYVRKYPGIPRGQH